MELGVYRFGDTTEINMLIKSQDEANITILHETIHLLLTKRTKWGNFAYLINRISNYEKSNSHIMGELCLHSRKVQEAAAVFSECIFIFNKAGDEGLDFYLTNMKKNNKKYYNYLNKLFRFLKILNSNNDIYAESEELNFLILYIASLALNSKIEEINKEDILRKKMFKKFMSKKSNVEKFIPNKKFNILLDYVYKEIKISQKFCLEELLKKLQNDKNFIESYNIDFDFDISNYFKELKLYIINLYINSPKIEEIKNDLEQIVLKKIDIRDLPLYSFPESFTKFKQSSKILEDNELISIIKDKVGMIFYLSDAEQFAIEAKKTFKLDNSETEKVRKSTEGKYMNVFYDLSEKKMYHSCNTKKELEKIISDKNNILISNYKLYDSKIDAIRDFENVERHNIIYCDRTYPNAIDYINEISKDRENSRCGIIEYRNMFLLVIKLTPKTTFILPIVPIAYKNLFSDVSNNKLNVKFDDNLIKNDSELIMYDIIMNCLFQITDN